MFFEKARWQYAIEKGLFKDMNKAVMYQLTTPEARLAMYQRIKSGNYKIMPPHTAKIPKDNGDFRTVYVNEPVDRILLSIANDLLFELMPEMVHPRCTSYQKGIGCGRVVQDVSRIIYSAVLLFFLGLEMASVPMACLVAFDKYRHNSAEAGAKFVLTATFSSGVMIYGISLLYAACGTLYFNDMAHVISASPLTIAGMVFFFSGLGFKISLVPFHFWTADSYQGAPTTVTGYLSVVSKGAAAFTLCAILMKVFQPMVEYWTVLLYIVIVLSITIANLFAIRQSDLKRFMAFSSISQAGYIMLAVVGNSAMSVSALTYYVLIYVVANLSVFTIISSIEEHNNGTVQMDSYNGLYKTNPRLAFLMTLALFSLGGIPPFAGMFSKFFVFMAAVGTHDIHTTLGAWAYGVVFIALVNTVISLYYYLLIVKAMFIKHSDNPLPTFQSACSTKLALAICTVGIVAFGICSFVFDWISVAVNA